MKIIADANVLFSLVKEGSVTERIVSDFRLQIYSVDFVLEELKNHEDVLLRKSGLQSFAQVESVLKKRVIFVRAADLKKELKKIHALVCDEKDLIYFALAEKLQLLIWSNDKHFKEQTLFDVVTTKELLELLF
ncbi:MAG: PIN domain-containing protein [Candidatus Woesearchaeota archaeon]